MYVPPFLIYNPSSKRTYAYKSYISHLYMHIQTPFFLNIVSFSKIHLYILIDINIDIYASIFLHP